MKRKNLVIIIVISLSSFMGCAYYNTFYNARNFYDQADKERKKRQRTQVVQLSPEEIQQQQKQGYSASETEADKPSSVEMQNYQRAIEKASNVLEFFPKSRWVDDALMMVGECFYYRREYTKSQRKFEEIIKLYPKSSFIPKANLMLAQNYLGLREFDKAENKFRDIALDDKMPKDIRQEAEYELAGLYFEKGNFEQAAEEYRRTSKQSDDKFIRAMSYYRLGECAISLHQFEEAPAAFGEAIDKSPNEDFKAQATFKFGEAQSLVGNFDAAIRTFSALLAKELELRRIPMIKLQLANNLRLKGELEQGLKWYKNIIEEHKNTDASAKSYFALGDIEENLNSDYKKAKENYELVRGEFASSLIAPDAKKRAENIKTMLELRQAIDELLGIAAVKDSLKSDGKNKKNRDEQTSADDASIDLSLDGMWVNYSGRNRPAPRANSEEAAVVTATNVPVAQLRSDSSVVLAGVPKVVADSLTLAREAEKAKRQKAITLAEKELALAELMLFNFNKTDSAISLYQKVMKSEPDTILTPRAIYSFAYVLHDIKEDTVHADSVLKFLVQRYPNSPHAEGARRLLGLPLRSEKIDSAAILFRQAEVAFYSEKDTSKTLSIFESIPVRYPQSPFAIKAQFAIGWTFEQKGDYDAAVAKYKKIVEQYTKDEISKKLQAKLEARDRQIKLAEEKQKAHADSLAKAATALAQGPVDSLKISATDSSAQIASDDSSRAIAGAVVPDSTAEATIQNQNPINNGMSEEEMQRKALMERRQAQRKKMAAKTDGEKRETPAEGETESGLPLPNVKKNDVPE